MATYLCRCGHEVESDGPPQEIKWTDGHVCRFGRSEQEKVQAAMDAAGFQEAGSGGGCVWYIRETPTGYQAVTDLDGVSLPERLDDKVLMGNYDKDMEPWPDEDAFCREVNSLREFINETATPANT